jgi:hypothetical protein
MQKTREKPRRKIQSAVAPFHFKAIHQLVDAQFRQQVRPATPKTLSRFGFGRSDIGDTTCIRRIDELEIERWKMKPEGLGVNDGCERVN